LAQRAIFGANRQIVQESVQGSKIQPRNFQPGPTEVYLFIFGGYLKAGSHAPGPAIDKSSQKGNQMESPECVTKAELEKMFSDQVRAIADSSGVINQLIENIKKVFTLPDLEKELYEVSGCQ